ncbi:MaoC family dehydratase [Psychrobacter sp. I-STPA6b]|uniref:MaoC family dehydratase n=1 Tax=Psychrobacter sp. I-STPA6b TaxID=2585718 RepID=UPI001D0C4C21|nr:MaoC family dehydratase [Psychrobacter sp. I-STPA6b]
MDKVYLEDLKIGDTWTSREITISSDSIKDFAKDYDPQPFHLDEQKAKDTFFQGLAGSGWQTACLTMRLMVESIPIADGLIGAGGEISWNVPTRPNDTLHIVAEVIAIKPSRSKPDRGIVTVQIDTINQNGDYAQRFTCKMLVFRRT